MLFYTHYYIQIRKSKNYLKHYLASQRSSHLIDVIVDCQTSSIEIESKKIAQSTYIYCYVDFKNKLSILHTRKRRRRKRQTVKVFLENSMCVLFFATNSTRHVVAIDVLPLFRKKRFICNNA